MVHQGKTILLVEDDAVISLFTCKVVEGFGYVVVAAYNGAEAVKMAAVNPDISLVLMDIDLGKGIDGPEAARQILLQRQLPIVFLTSHAEQQYVERIKQITRYGYVIKNSGDFVLQTSIEMAFQLYEAHRNLQEREQSLSITLQSIGDAVIATDIVGNITRMNTMAEQLTGWSFATAQGQPLAQVFRIFNSQTRVAVEDPVSWVLSSGSVVGLANHTVLVGKDGSEYQVSDSAAPIRDATGQIQGVILVFSDVSSKYAVERALKSSELRFRSLFENLNSNFALHEILLDDQGKAYDYRFLEVNPAFEENVGLPASAIVGHTAKELFPDTEDYWIQKFAEVAITGIPDKYENYSRALGRYYEIILYSPCQYQFAMIGLDVTERKRAEAEVAMSRQMYQDLVETSQDLIWRCDAAGCYTYLNVAWEEVFGYTTAEMLGRKFTDFQSPEQAALDLVVFEKLIGGGSIKNYETIHLGKDGREIHLAFNAKFLSDGAGAIEGSFGTAYNISGRKLAEARLRESDEIFAQFMEHSPVYVFFKDEQIRSLRLSRNFEAWLGRPMEQLIGKTMDELFPSDLARKMIEDDKLILFEDREVRVDENFAGRHYTTIKFPISIKGKPRYLAGYTIDITERVQNSERISKLLREKDLLLQEAHHRVKNNMNTIYAIISLQIQTLRDPSAIQALVDAKTRIQSMIVLYDKLSLGNGEDAVWLDEYLPALAAEIVDNFPNSDAVQITSTIEHVRLDAKRTSSLGLIVNELLTNIMKYAFIGREDGHIILTIACLERNFLVSIQDNGNGLPETVDFERSAGFGLVIIRNLAQQLEGTLTIERVVGTTIRLIFPVQQA